MSWKFFIGSCILATGLLLKMGAPIIPIAVGLAAAAYVTARQRGRMPAKKR